MYSLQNKTLIIVFLGDFNPSIFQPYWYSHHGLISNDEAEKAQIKLIHPDITDFGIDWFNIQITRDRFIIKTQQESHFDPIYDLIMGTFSLLKETPLKRMGINFEAHVKMRDENTWNNYGDKLAPKEIWKRKFNRPGLNVLQIKSDRLDEYNGYILATIKPSNELQYGVHFHINDHYELTDPNEMVDSSFLLDVFAKEKQLSVNRSIDLINSLLEE